MAISTSISTMNNPYAYGKTIYGIPLHPADEERLRWASASEYDFLIREYERKYAEIARQQQMSNVRSNVYVNAGSSGGSTPVSKPTTKQPEFLSKNNLLLLENV